MTIEENIEPELSPKETIRRQCLKHRERMDLRDEDIEVIPDMFFEAIKPVKEQVIALFWPKEREFDLSPLLERLLNEGWICALPVVEKDTRILKFARFKEGGTLEKRAFDVMQPEQNDQTEWLEPDIIVVPFLAFDRHGYRIGYGGGYYDATLADLRSRKKIIAVGMGYDQQAVLFNLPKEDHDEPLDWVITPQKARKHNRET